MKQSPHRRSACLGTCGAILALAALGASCGDEEPAATAEAPAPSSLKRSLPRPDDERDAVLFGEALPPVTDWLADNIERRDAGFDGWTTEVLHDRAKHALHDFLEAVLHQGDHALDEVVTAAFRMSELVPETLETVVDDDGVRVRQGAPSGSTDHGSEALGQLVQPFGDTANAIEAHKIVSVERRPENRFATRALVQIETRREDGRTQHNLTLDLEWLAPPEDEEHVRLERLTLVRYEEARFAERPLVDVTESVFGSLAAWPDELLLGVDHYHLATDKLVGQSFLGMQGIAVGDVTGDGLDDVYVCQQAGLPNRLLVRQPDGSLEDRSNKANLALVDRTRSALILDFDGDGQRDVALAIGNRLAVLYNEGGGVFPEPNRYRVAGPGPSPPASPRSSCRAPTSPRSTA